MAPTSATNLDLRPRQATDMTTVLPGQTPEGQHILGLLLKRTYDIIPNSICDRAKQDQPLVPGDVYWDDPMNSSFRHESDFIPFKLATDVVLNGKAYAPGGEPVTSCVVALQVGEQRKEVLVLGDRVARFVKDEVPRFTEPTPFITMELRYERAYGGIDIYSDKRLPYPYPRNPLGRGFAVVNSEKTVENLALPNLEDPTRLLKPEQLCLGQYEAWEQQPIPAGLGWFPKTWMPRAKLAGIMPADRATEQELRQAYAQLVPLVHRDIYVKNGLPDMDFRFFNGASPGLVFPYLKGGERIVTENLSAEGQLNFQLPNEIPGMGLDIGFTLQEPEVVLHTVMIRMEERQVDLVWRGAILYPGRDWFPQMRKMDVFIA